MSAFPLVALGVVGLVLVAAANASASTQPRGVASPGAPRRFTVQLVKEVGGEKFFDCFLQPGNTRVLRFAQRGDDKSTRREITHPPGTDPAVLAAARKFYLGT